LNRFEIASPSVFPLEPYIRPGIPVFKHIARLQRCEKEKAMGPCTAQCKINTAVSCKNHHDRIMELLFTGVPD